MEERAIDRYYRGKKRERRRVRKDTAGRFIPCGFRSTCLESFFRPSRQGFALELPEEFLTTHLPLDLLCPLSIKGGHTFNNLHSTPYRELAPFLFFLDFKIPKPPSLLHMFYLF